jgi:hypothetical protein
VSNPLPQYELTLQLDGGYEWDIWKAFTRINNNLDYV